MLHTSVCLFTVGQIKSTARTAAEYLTLILKVEMIPCLKVALLAHRVVRYIKYRQPRNTDMYVATANQRWNHKKKKSMSLKILYPTGAGVEDMCRHRFMLKCLGWLRVKVFVTVDYRINAHSVVLLISASDKHTVFTSFDWILFLSFFFGGTSSTVSSWHWKHFREL